MSLASEVISDIEHRFSYHPNLSDAVGEAHNKIRSIMAQAAKDALEVATDIAPYGREAALALTALEDADQWFHAHVARNQDVPVPAAVDTPVDKPEADIASPQVEEPAAPLVSDTAPVADVAPVEPVAPVEAAPVDVAPEAAAPVEAQAPVTTEPVSAEAPPVVAPADLVTLVAPDVPVAPVDAAQPTVAASPFTAPTDAVPGGTVQVDAPAPAVVPEAPAYFTYTGDAAAVAGLAEWPVADVQGTNGETLYTHATADAFDAAAWVAYTGPTQPVPAAPVA